MYKNKFTLLAIISVFLLRCNQIEIKKKDISGEWIINKAVYNDTKIVMPSKTLKLALVPAGFKGKEILNFNIKDSTVVFPGIYTEDVPCKWFIKNKKLIIAFDTLAFQENALASIDNLRIEGELRHDQVSKKTYSFKRDSILKSNNVNSFKLPLSVYAGTYTILKANSELVLTSSTTRFELINLDDLLKKKVDEMFDGR